MPNLSDSRRFKKRRDVRELEMTKDYYLNRNWRERAARSASNPDNIYGVLVNEYSFEVSNAGSYTDNEIFLLVLGGYDIDERDVLSYSIERNETKQAGIEEGIIYIRVITKTHKARNISN